MKKKLLFVMPSLSAGGGEKSLVNLLSQINYDLYDVDLFLFNRTGVFLKSLPSEVNILELPVKYEIFTKGLMSSIKLLLKKRQFLLAYNRIMFSIKNRVFKNNAVSEQYSWKHQSKFIDTFEKRYDASIGFLEKSSIYLVIEKVKSKKKIGWIHTNYKNSGMDREFDRPYFNQLDHVVTVSEECANALNGTFNSLHDKVKVIYNVVSPKIIQQLSDSDVEDMPNSFCESEIKLITIARLSYEKGIDIAVETCKQLVEKGYNVKWRVIGEGNERNHLEEMIIKRGLENHFFLLGIKENPYPYLKKSDIYIQPSRYEGKSLAIDEAKILQKPIVVTDYETAKDQIADGKNGLIVDMNEKGLSEGIERLIQDKNLKRHLISNLSNEHLGTENEIIKLYEII